MNCRVRAFDFQSATEPISLSGRFDSALRQTANGLVEAEQKMSPMVEEPPFRTNAPRSTAANRAMHSPTVSDHSSRNLEVTEGMFTSRGSGQQSRHAEGAATSHWNLCVRIYASEIRCESDAQIRFDAQAPLPEIRFFPPQQAPLAGDPGSLTECLREVPVLPLHHL